MSSGKGIESRLTGMTLVWVEPS